MDKKDLEVIEEIRKKAELRYWIVDFQSGQLFPNVTSDAGALCQIIRQSLMVRTGRIQPPFTRAVGFVSGTHSPYNAWVLARHVPTSNPNFDSSPIIYAHFNDLETTDEEMKVISLLRDELYLKEVVAKPGMEINSEFSELAVAADEFYRCHSLAVPMLSDHWSRLNNAVINAYK